MFLAVDVLEREKNSVFWEGDDSSISCLERLNCSTHPFLQHNQFLLGELVDQRWFYCYYLLSLVFFLKKKVVIYSLFIDSFHLVIFSLFRNTPWRNKEMREGRQGGRERAVEERERAVQ